MMVRYSSQQLPSIVPEGTYSIAIASIGGNLLRSIQGVLQAVNPARCTAVADFISLNEGPYRFISGVETKQYDVQIEFWSPGWKAIANYSWWIAGQNTTVASLWTTNATVWRPTSAEEFVYSFCIGGLAVQTAIAEKKTTSAVTWLLPAATVSGLQDVSSDSVHLQQPGLWIAKLESLSALVPGWNRHGAPAPSKEAVSAARQFIEAMVDDGQPPTRVAASAVGGVGVSRQVGKRIAYVEFYNDGAACALLADDAADERILDVPPERGSFRNLLDEVKAYLNG